jgi:hypothetical protein
MPHKLTYNSPGKYIYMCCCEVWATVFARDMFADTVQNLTTLQAKMQYV